MDKNTTKNSYLVIETIVVFITISGAAVLLQKVDISPFLFWSLYIPLLLFQGFWFYRFYIVGHESAHRKLFMNFPKLNDFIGTIILLPLMTPINIYRKIHYFHHGFNRKDHHHSALDTFVLKKKPNILQKIYYHILWYISVFFGGFFIHSLVSVLLFLFIPPQISARISPAFKGWTWNDQFKAIALFSLGVGFHLSVFFFLGKSIYLYTLGFPMLSFAWVLSLLVYIFHYDTTKGDKVQYNVRSVERVPIISWILMNFNDHATHHQQPTIPWYQLPKKRKSLPENYATKNQNTRNFFRAIFNQLKGPIKTNGRKHNDRRFSARNR